MTTSNTRFTVNVEISRFHLSTHQLCSSFKPDPLRFCPAEQLQKVLPARVQCRAVDDSEAAMVQPLPISSSQCTCQKCGAEFYVGRTHPSRSDDYLIPEYCPVCGVAKSLAILTLATTVKGADPSRVVNFDGECSICGRTMKEHSVEGIVACGQKQRDITLKDVRCPICNKPVLAHSHSESVACLEKDRATKHD
jgi:hypothetical protein